MMCGSNKKYIACPAIPNQRKLTEEDEVKSTVSESKPLTKLPLLFQGGSNKKTHRVSRDTKTEKNRRFLRFFVLSPLPKIGKGFGKRLKPLITVRAH
jgi:hypothetical protein